MSGKAIPVDVYVNKGLYLSDYLFKFLIIGSAGSGKSCLLHHFIEQKCEYLIFGLPEAISESIFS